MTDRIKSVYFLGAGGIGMSALVRYFLSENIKVAGYDKTATPLTDALIAEGAQIHFTDDSSLIPEYCRIPSETLVVYTPAIPQEHSEWKWFRDNGFQIMKRAQVLGVISRNYKALCVAGTHGKTTTSTMIAHILMQGTDKCNAFLGGISKNYKSNLLLSKQSDYVVIEADEFDRSFHALNPFRSVVTAMDADHLDIYGNHQNYIDSFKQYVSHIRPDGDLIVKKGLEELLAPALQDGVRLFTYSASDGGDFHAENIRTGNGTLCFDFVSKEYVIRDISLGQPFPINVENGVAAIAMALLSGATEEQVRKGMATFMGADRRFDFHLNTPEKVYISDYAHHPKELQQSALSISQLYAAREITAIFQPHLYSRTRDFYKDFAKALNLFSKVWLVDIYPARELPIPGITSQIIADNMEPGKCLGVISKDKVLPLVESIKDSVDVLVTLGAGDLDNYADEIAEILK